MAKERDISIGMDVSNAQGFNDLGHIGHFLNYLFRTDKIQKWTNDDTSKNLLGFYVDDKLQIVSFPDDLVVRTNLMKTIKRTLPVERMIPLNAENLSHQRLLNDIVYLDITLKATGETIQDSLTPVELDDIFKAVIPGKPALPNEQFFHVLHADQAGQSYHIHTVGY